MGVRIIQANGLDLNQFQFDHDLTFAAFFLNADGTIYGRYGSRSSLKESERDISLEGFAKALDAVASLHQAYPENKALFAGNRGPKARYARPEAYPMLGKYGAELDVKGKIVQSCMHCHQIRDAERSLARQTKKAMPDALIHPWAMPDVLGLDFDPKEIATIEKVVSGSPAAKDGFRAGDRVTSVDGRPVTSVADLQWALEQASEPGAVKLAVTRGGEAKTLSLTLASGWRRANDISWRPSTWNLRRIAFGGMMLKSLPDEDYAKHGLKKDQMALNVQHVGQFGEHAIAFRAGVKKGDVVVALDGLERAMSESDAISHILRTRMPGEPLAVSLLRGGKRVDLKLTLP